MKFYPISYHNNVIQQHFWWKISLIKYFLLFFSCNQSCSLLWILNSVYWFLFLKFQKKYIQCNHKNNIFQSYSKSLFVLNQNISWLEIHVEYFFRIWRVSYLISREFHYYLIIFFSGKITKNIIVFLQKYF